jgi:L-ascorbate metabolism protein UlaG (beta-lactamase superfamily)
MNRLAAAVRRLAGRTRPAYPPSDHYDGRRFHNPEPIVHRLTDVLRWLRNRPDEPWQPTQDFTPAPAPAARVAHLRVTWIGHASLLVQSAGHNLLIDPVFSQRVGPLPGLGAPRYHPPGIDFDALPQIDTVLTSHAHYDHLDRPTIRRLIRRYDPQIVAGLGLTDWFRNMGSRRVKYGDWWQRIPLADGTAVTIVPARHWSRRGLFDRNRSLWAGYWLDTPAGGLYFAGDTGFGDHFAAIRQRLGTPRVALLPIGAYEPRWFMAPQHMNPAEAVAAHAVLGAQTSIGIHFGTFKLSDEAQHAPVQELAIARRAAGIEADAFVAPAPGQSFDFG